MSRLCMVFVVMVVVLALGGLVYSAYWEFTHECVRSHVEHRRAYTSLMLIGKVFIPVHHPARDVSVCDEWAPKQ